MKRFGFIATTLALLAVSAVHGQEKNPAVVMKTSLGDIKIELYPKKAPATVKNFLKYVDNKQYDGTIFHRVIENFMIQGGGFTKDRKEKETGKPIKNESTNGLSNKRGTIAMARTAAPHSATAQFYINVKDNPALDARNGRFGYTVFGKVIDGMDVVDKIKKVATGQAKFQARLPSGQYIEAKFSDVPQEQVVIKSVRRVKKK